MSQNIRVVGVIPARWASTRFPGKPLAVIAGKPLLQWVIEGVQTARSLSEIIVATDDERIASLARKSGVRAVMTDSGLATGTDRAWAAAQESIAEVIVNIQGDEPLIEGQILDVLVAPFQSDAGQTLNMATLARELDLEALQSPNTAKIVLNQNNEALYFSRFPIPYSREKNPTIPNAALKHIGIYAYRRDFLRRFCSQAPCAIELMEGLEQLRALQMGERIKVLKVEHDSWGVDTPEDVQKIESMLRIRGKI